jgi:hypothetical protein
VGRGRLRHHRNPGFLTVTRRRRRHP